MRADSFVYLVFLGVRDVPDEAPMASRVVRRGSRGKEIYRRAGLEHENQDCIFNPAVEKGGPGICAASRPRWLGSAQESHCYPEALGR